MKVIQEQLPDSQVGLEIEIPAEASKQTYEKVLRKLMRTANVPGFRKGKVPRPIFLQRFGSTQIRAAALEELVQTSVEQAIKQEDIAAIGNYQLTTEFEELIQQYVPGEPLTVKASVDVPPRITLEGYLDLTTQAEEVLYEASQVEAVLEQYRLNLATLVPIEDRPAEMGDVAVVDFSGKIQQADGSYEAFEGGTAEDFQLEIKPGGFIEGFVEGMVGMALDDTRDIEATFPEQYPQEELAGKLSVFTVTLKELKEKELPDLDDDFAQEVSEFETLAELRESLTERYQKEAVRNTKENQHEALLKALVKKLEVEIPETLIRREANNLLSQTIMQLSRQGLDVNKMFTPEIADAMRDRARPDAIDSLKRTLALAEVAKQESLTVDEADIQARMDEMLGEVQEPEKVDQERLREVVNEELLKDTILDWLLEKNTVELVPEGSLTHEDEELEASPVEPEAADETSQDSDTIEVTASAVVPSDEDATAEAAAEAAVEGTASDDPTADDPEVSASTAPEEE